MHVAFSFLLLASVSAAAAPAARDPRPPATPYRVEENWAFLRDPALRTDPVDALKFIPLDPEGTDFVTLGGEARHVWRYFHNEAWGAQPDDANGYHLIRLMLNADVRLGAHWRIYGELKSGLVEGKITPIRPADRDDLDLHQAFVERRDTTSSVPWLLRVGRQEFHYGSGRILTFREGPNVRQSFDAALFRVQPGAWKIDTLCARPAETTPGIFDNQTDDQQLIYGFYAVTPLTLLKGANLDLYYLGYDRDNARFLGQSGDERRQSLGARFWGRRNALDYNFEALWQWGDFRTDEIRAWTVASDTGYTFASAPTSPRLGLKANIISGDRDPSDGRLGTFNALYPRGNYFGEIGLLGPANLVNLHPGITGKFNRSWGYGLATAFFWRESNRDGIYNSGGAVVRPPGSSTARYIGTQSDLSINWTYDRHFSVEVFYAHFRPGDFLRETGRHESVDFLSLVTRYRF